MGIFVKDAIFSIYVFARHMKILLIEDDMDDIELLQEALKKHAIHYKMDVARDGSAAVSYIKSCKDLPDLVVLDFNLPRIHGREVLLEIKSAPLFKNIPVLILTTSSAREDMEYSLSHGADKYLIKPTTLEGIRETVDTIVTLTKRTG